MKEEELFEDCLERAQVLAFFGVDDTDEFMAGLQKVHKSRDKKAFLVLLLDSLDGRFDRFCRILKEQLSEDVVDLVPVKNALVELEAKRNSGSFAVQLFEAKDAKWRIPPREYSEKEVLAFGCMSDSELEGVKAVLKGWAGSVQSSKNAFTGNPLSFKFSGRMWLAGSILVGRSPTKGVYLRDRKKLELYGPKPVDLEKLSDVDIGIEMDEDLIREYIPPHIFTVGANEALVAKKSVLLAQFLWSSPLGREEVKKAFFIRPNDKYFAFGYALLRLFDMLTAVKVSGVKLGEPPKARPVHVLFFVANDAARKLNNQVRCVLVKEP